MEKDFGKLTTPIYTAGKTSAKVKKLNGFTMFTILFSLFMLIIGVTAGLTYAGFQSNASSNGTLSFAVNGHQGDFSFSHSKISHYNSTDLELEFTLVGDENYNTPTVSITMGGTPLIQDGNNFKNGTIIIATYSVGVLTINRANVTGNLGITAISTINTYTVTYNATTNGGTTSATAVSVSHGSNADLTKTAAKTDWVFVGWNTSSSATTALSSCTVTANVTLYAIFSRVLTISYNNNGTPGSVSVTIYNTATGGTSTTNLPAVASRSGWTAYGWSNSSVANNTRADTNTASHAITITTSTTGSLYYATYYRTLTLSYNANGGNSTPASQTTTQYYNSAGSTSSHSFTLASAIAKNPTNDTIYLFKCWTQGSTGGTERDASTSVSINSDTVFYAKWDSAIRYYTISGMDPTISCTYGAVYTVGYGGQGPQQLIIFRLWDVDGNQVAARAIPMDAGVTNVYVNGVRKGGVSNPTSGTFTVTSDCTITFA